MTKRKSGSPFCTVLAMVMLVVCVPFLVDLVQTASAEATFGPAVFREFVEAADML